MTGRDKLMASTGVAILLGLAALMWMFRRSLAAGLQSTAEDEPAARGGRALAAVGRLVDPGGAHDTASAHDASLLEAYRR